MDENSFSKTEQNTVRRVPQRGSYDRDTVCTLLDRQLVAHVGFATPHGPTVIPMLFGRQEDELLFHGSTQSRLMRVLCSGDSICVSVTSLDGLVLAKSLFHHSLNYESVCVYGRGSEITGEQNRLAALKIISDKVVPGRWEDARSPSPQEMKATCVAAVRIESASVKIRTGPPVDDPADINLPVWSGIVPTHQIAGLPITAPSTGQSSPVPDYVNLWREAYNSGCDEAGAH